jgi:glutamate-1-semialdehyde 2,1-aminomutase
VADTGETNDALFARAQLVMPGGVNSPVRSFRSVGGTPYFVDRAEGPYVWDVEGKRYIDFVQSYGPGILGHAHPAITAAVSEAAADGTSYGAPTLREVELAEAITDRIDGLEMIRLTSSGTEAAMSAIRLARGATGRDKIIKFAGCYHGHADSLLAAGGSGVANQGLSGCDGVPAGAVSDTVVAPFNVVPEIDETVAVVCVEPVAANMGLVAPDPGFLQGLRDGCDAVGAMLLFDEVITGFRLAHGGAVEWSGVRPDVWAFGKVIGGGLPVGCFGASREIMGHVAPLGGVYQGGTLSGNPLATAAGLATLEFLDRNAYVELTRIATRLAEGMRNVFDAVGLPAVVPQVGPLVGLFFGDTTPTNFDEAKVLADNGVYPKFFHELLQRGVALAPGAYEILFPGLAHTDAVIDEALAAMAEAAAATTVE